MRSRGIVVNDNRQIAFLRVLFSRRRFDAVEFSNRRFESDRNLTESTWGGCDGPGLGNWCKMLPSRLPRYLQLLTRHVGFNELTLVSEEITITVPSF